MTTRSLAIHGGAPTRSGPYPSWPVAGDVERRLLGEVLDSGLWDSRYGKFVRTFEERFAAYQGVAHGVCVTNGEAALRLPLAALDLPAGSEIVVPAYTFIATATAVLQSGYVPVFADVDPATYCLDPAAVAAAVGPRTAAIMPVHIGGLPADMAGLRAVAERHGLAILEDAAQAWGARYDGRGVGAFGAAAGFSFHASKNLASGEGGIVLTDDDEFAGRCRSLANCGRGGDGERYRHVLLGGNFRMTEFQGALLCAGLDRYPGELARRTAAASALRTELEGVAGVSVQGIPNAVDAHAWHLFILRVDRGAFGGVPKQTIVDALLAEGIPATAGYHSTPYEQPVFGDPDRVPFRRGPCPVTERACVDEAIWIRQNALLGEVRDALDVARAIDKLQRNADELRAAAG